MPAFNGSSADEIITPGFVSPTVTTSGATAPSDALDEIDAGAGNDLIDSGGGNDIVIGSPGNDVALLGAGDDTFIWNPGDSSDIVEGQSGTDTLRFNGSNASEHIDISANGSRARLFRDVGNVTMDLGGIEHIQLATLGGADTVTVNDLSGTDAKQVAIDLSATPGSGQGDGVADTVNVNGTAGDDRISVVSTDSSVVVNGLAAQVMVSGVDAGLDRLVVNGGTGNDIINASAVRAGQISLALNGGDGNDTITGSAGDDTVIGGRGNDVAKMGAGDDTFVWNPGDGSDTVDGGAGNDTLLFNGANVNESMDISASDGHAIFSRDVGVVTMDLDHIENIDVNALGGANTITVDDLSKTDVKHVGIDLSAPLGSGQGDGQVDTVVINATNSDDAISINDNNGVITVSGLATDVTITGFEANDRIVINGLGGDDIINAFGLGGAMQFIVNGGDGNDILIGSRGSDTLSGGAGDDTLIGNGGTDVLDGGTGNNLQFQAVMNPGSAMSNAPPVAGAALLGQFMASSLVSTGIGLGGMPLADPTPDQQPLLTQPHAA
jgi:Ca2+-binding RTX toxin-like protein